MGDDRYVGNSYVFDIAGDRIISLTHTFAQGPVDGFENHISEVLVRWIQTNHPDDSPTMFTEDGLIQSTPEALSLWQTYTAEFVTEAQTSGG